MNRHFDILRDGWKLPLESDTFFSTSWNQKLLIGSPLLMRTNEHGVLNFRTIFRQLSQCAKAESSITKCNKAHNDDSLESREVVLQTRTRVTRKTERIQR